MNSKWNIQCINGHCNTVPKGHPLEKRCEERAAAGYLDALMVGHDDCFDCIQESIWDLEKSIDHYSMYAVTGQDWKLVQGDIKELNRLRNL